MRTTAFAPPFPTDLGTWLACFRHRLTDAKGHPYSPEQLGREIGVSGATVRRWESGRLRPNLDDAANLARACRLTSFQIAFLNRALRTGGPMPVPDFKTFRERITPILAVEFPTYIMDGMMYIRAWNSYVPRFLGRRKPNFEGNYHAIDFLTDADQNPGVHPSLRGRISRAVQEFWYLTADICGTEEYQALVLRLAANDVFKQEWASLPFVEEANSQPMGLPRTAFREDIGKMMICPFVLVLPPIYQGRQFLPMDEVAQAKLDELRLAGPPKVLFDEHAHWAHASEDASFVRI